MKLFDIPIEKPEITCRTCEFKFKHTYGKMLYCSKFKQPGTAYGFKKIKSGDKACELYSEK